MSKVTVIYHKNCLDGTFAARAVYHHIKHEYSDADITFVTANYGDTPPDVTGQVVYIVDFSYPKETLLAMADTAKHITVLDHHVTAQDNLRGINRDNVSVHFDMDKSGSGIAWSWFTPHGTELPPIIKHVQDRDLWRFDYPETKAVCAALYLEGLDNPKGSLDYDIEDLVSQGLVVLKYQEQLLDKLTAPDKVSVFTFSGYENVAFVNSPVLQSEIGERLSLKHPFVVIHYQAVGQQIYSLRSNKANPQWVDVAKFAKQFGGGGHATAAGFIVSLPDHLVEGI